MELIRALCPEAEVTVDDISGKLGGFRSSYLLNALLCGFDLDLFSSSDFQAVYFVASRMAWLSAAHWTKSNEPFSRIRACEHDAYAELAAASFEVGCGAYET